MEWTIGKIILWLVGGIVGLFLAFCLICAIYANFFYRDKKREEILAQLPEKEKKWTAERERKAREEEARIASLPSEEQSRIRHGRIKEAEREYNRAKQRLDEIQRNERERKDEEQRRRERSAASNQMITNMMYLSYFVKDDKSETKPSSSSKHRSSGYHDCDACECDDCDEQHS
jgi:phosphate/sulfate permease